MKNQNLSVRKLARCGMVAALYVVLCMALQPFSYGAVQVRVAEALCLLPVFGAEYIFGVVLGLLFGKPAGLHHRGRHLRHSGHPVGLPRDLQAAEHPLQGSGPCGLAAPGGLQCRHHRHRDRGDVPGPLFQRTPLAGLRHQRHLRGHR